MIERCIIIITLLFAFENVMYTWGIINGSDTAPNEFPFMVSLESNNKHFCAGTVLNKKFVLSAAHCVCNISVTNLTAHLTHSLDDPQGKIPVHSIICNKNYSLIERNNDIALLELKTEISQEKYHPVKLVPQNFSTEYDLNGTLVGWGTTETGSPSTILKKIDVIVYNDSTCSSSHFGMYDMEKNMCAGWPQDGKGSCQGDSGGPLIVEEFQAGIISFGIGSSCGISNRDQPKVLTRVSKYVEWIKVNSQYIRKNSDLSTKANVVLFCFCILISIFAHNYIKFDQ